MKEVINLKAVDFTKEPMFFGEDLGIQRYDVFKYKKFFDLAQDQLSFFWRPQEVDINKDKLDFKTLSEHERDIFTKNLKYQILLDSVQARAISQLCANVSIPELESCMLFWQAFEAIHSFSYTYIIKNVYPTISEVYDTLMDDEKIVSRATSVTKYYNNLIKSMKADTVQEQKEKLYLTLISVNILEGIRFYVSFACSYAFAENKKMEGNAKIIALINRDENLHLAITQNILNIMHSDPSEGFSEIAQKYREQVIAMYTDAAKEEMEWAKYLFKDGSILGLNDEILIKYMMWLTNKRASGIGIGNIFESVENPINWIKHWTTSKDVQEAPQETEKESYKIGSFKQDADKVAFENYNF
jgi:ribonucleoside-diphosphate reductase beta chain